MRVSKQGEFIVVHLDGDEELSLQMAADLSHLNGGKTVISANDESVFILQGSKRIELDDILGVFAYEAKILG